MSDREILELAAKAVGYTLREHYEGFPPIAEELNAAWNPLTDDGDALRLAVKLQMEIAIFGNECHTKCAEHGQTHWTEEQGDPYAATRQAIVKAAAEIGRQMT